MENDERTNLFEKFFDLTDDIVCLSDRDGKFEYVNQKGKEIFGIKDIVSESIFCSDCFGCFNIARIPKISSAKHLKGLSQEGPLRLACKINDKTFLLNCTPIYDESGELSCILHIAKDITEEVSKEKALKHLNQVLKAIRNVNQLIFVEKDATKILEKTCGILLEILDYVFVGFFSPEKSFFGENGNLIFGEPYGIAKFGQLGNSNQISSVLERAKAKIKGQDSAKLYASKYLLWEEKIDKIQLYGILVPLVRSGNRYGYFAVYSRQPVENEKKILLELAGDVSLALYTLEVETKKQELESKMHEQEHFFYRLFETLPGFVYRCRNDRFWTMEYLSDNFEKITGYKPEEVIGNKLLSFNDLIHPDHRERIWFKWQTNLKQRNVIQDEYPIVTKNGEIRWVFEQSCGIYDENGYAETLQGYIVDITDRKIIEEKLIESEKKYRALFEASTDAIFILVADTFVDCNYTALDLFETTKEDLVGKTLYFFSPEFQPDGISSKKEILDYIRRAYKGEVLRFEWTFKTHKGNLLATKVSLNRVLAGGKSYLVAVVRDLTEIEKLNNELKQLTQALQSIGDSIIITSPDKRILYVNSGFEKLYGYTADEVTGKDVAFLVPEGATSNELEYILEKAISEGVWRGETLRVKKDGTLCVVHLTVTPVFNVKNQLFGYVSVATDLTEKKKLEEELIRAKEKAEELSSLKSYLLMNFSHEFRTPLTGIMGYAQYLMLQRDEPELKEIGSIFYQSGYRLLTTLNLIMDYSKIETGILTVKPNEFDLVTVVEDLVKLYSMFFKEKNLMVQFHTEFEQISMYQDEAMIRSVVASLISNAFKFTQKGEIEVKVTQLQRNGTEQVEISIGDTGIGISEEHLEYIWKEFYQVSQGLSREFEGSGLGLTVAKKFVELMGGEINVSSKVGVGSTFTIILPTKYFEKVY